MPAATFYQPIEKILDGKCDYEYYIQTRNSFSKDSKSRICHVLLNGSGEKNKNLLLMIFTIRNQPSQEKEYVWKIHSEGSKRMDPGATVPLRNTAVKLAQENGWKYIAIAVASDDAPDSEIVSKYVISMESYSYGNDTVYDLTNELIQLERLGCPDFYRSDIKLNGNKYTLSFIKKERLLDYLTLFDDRPYGSNVLGQDALKWHKNEPTNEEYSNFKELLRFFVNQLNVNNDLVQGEKRYVDSGKPNSRAFVEHWVFNGFELSCRFAKGYKKTYDGANYLNYYWVNINPHFNADTKWVESLSVNTKPNNTIAYQGEDYLLDVLSLFDDQEPSAALKKLFVEFRDEIFKWQRGDYSDSQETATSKVCYETSLDSTFSRNRIIFGAPGTGKSYLLEAERKKLLGDVADNNYERVTFHPDYSYAHFVGTYKPVPSFDESGNETITYKFVPGPFMRIYTEALRSGMNDSGAEAQPYLLIIEEINRANVAAVFGDIFQLLDRNDNNVSEYPIQASEDIKHYLVSELGGTESDYSSIKIPNNLFIWATMNSADQGVFPMDTAFKRRWDFTYLGIDDNDDAIKGKFVKLGKGDAEKEVEWNSLRKSINTFLAKSNINEDKQLGPYFIAKRIVIPYEGEIIEKDRFVETFLNKVIMYLFEDAAKQKRAYLFAGCTKDKNRYSEICKDFIDRGIGIFCQEIISSVNVRLTSSNGDDESSIVDSKDETNE